MTACLFRCKQLQIELEQHEANATSSVAAVVNKISDDARDDELLRSWCITQKKIFWIYPRIVVVSHLPSLGNLGILFDFQSCVFFFQFAEV